MECYMEWMDDILCQAHLLFSECTDTRHVTMKGWNTALRANADPQSLVTTISDQNGKGRGSTYSLCNLTRQFHIGQ